MKIYRIPKHTRFQRRTSSSDLSMVQFPLSTSQSKLSFRTLQVYHWFQLPAVLSVFTVTNTLPPPSPRPPNIDPTASTSGTRILAEIIFLVFEISLSGSGVRLNRARVLKWLRLFQRILLISELGQCNENDYIYRGFICYSFNNSVSCNRAWSYKFYFYIIDQVL